MSKYTVEQIKKQAENTLEDNKERLDSELYDLNVANVRSECRKVLFLCREIERLRKSK